MKENKELIAIKLLKRSCSETYLNLRKERYTYERY
jgi:hypothetical protein